MIVTLSELEKIFNRFAATADNAECVGFDQFENLIHQVRILISTERMNENRILIYYISVYLIGCSLVEIWSSWVIQGKNSPIGNCKEHYYPPSNIFVNFIFVTGCGQKTNGSSRILRICCCIIYNLQRINPRTIGM